MYAAFTISKHQINVTRKLLSQTVIFLRSIVYLVNRVPRHTMVVIILLTNFGSVTCIIIEHAYSESVNQIIEDKRCLVGFTDTLD